MKTTRSNDRDTSRIASSSRKRKSTLSSGESFGVSFPRNLIFSDSLSTSTSPPTQASDSDKNFGCGLALRTSAPGSISWPTPAEPSGCASKEADHLYVLPSPIWKRRDQLAPQSSVARDRAARTTSNSDLRIRVFPTPDTPTKRFNPGSKSIPGNAHPLSPSENSKRISRTAVSKTFRHSRHESYKSYTGIPCNASYRS